MVALFQVPYGRTGRHKACPYNYAGYQARVGWNERSESQHPTDHKKRWVSRSSTQPTPNPPSFTAFRGVLSVKPDKSGHKRSETTWQSCASRDHHQNKETRVRVRLTFIFIEFPCPRTYTFSIKKKARLFRAGFYPACPLEKTLAERLHTIQSGENSSGKIKEFWISVAMTRENV
ncbi:MAG: hypothetical protein LBE22_08710 [Azoarcus sp.]|nr:hypothetical protein [Azoarcus sp.]